MNISKILNASSILALMQYAYCVDYDNNINEGNRTSHQAKTTTYECMKMTFNFKTPEEKEEWLKNMEIAPTDNRTNHTTLINGK